jgi:hypothetical protein
MVADTKGLTSVNRGPNGQVDPEMTAVTCGGLLLGLVAPGK